MNLPIKLLLASFAIVSFGSMFAAEADMEGTDVVKGLKKYSCLRVGTLTVCNNETVNGNLTVGGNESIAGTLSVGGNETVGGNLSVAGSETVGSLAVLLNETVGGNLLVTGTVVVGGNLIFNDNSALPLNAVGSAETADVRMVWGGTLSNAGEVASNSSGIASITSTSAGLYDITWTTQFTTTPFVVASIADSSDTGYTINIISETISGCTIETYSGGSTPGLIDASFNLIAIGK